MKQIGDTLKQLRKTSGKKSSEIIEELRAKHGISIAQSTLYGYENGHANPNIDIFLALCLIYNCQDILYTFGYTDQPKAFAFSQEDSQIIKKYHALPSSGQNMILGALGIDKSKQNSQKIS